MNKNALTAALALVVVSGWLVGARAQDGSPVKGEPSYGTVPPGQVGGPVENHPELWTPEHLKEEAEAAKEYCRTHECRTTRRYLPGWRESLDRDMRAWSSSHPGFGEGVADPSHLTQCERDPAHPNGPSLCYRASDYSQVYPGTHGPN
jgi:hypothetical protein